MVVCLHSDQVPFRARDFGFNVLAQLHFPYHSPVEVHGLVRLLLVDLVEALGPLVVRPGKLLVFGVLKLLESCMLSLGAGRW